MIGIICHHLIVHSTSINIYNDNYILQFIILLFASFGKIGLHIFAILTGYFSFKKEIPMKKIYIVAFQIWFLTMFLNIFLLIFKGNILTWTDIFPVFKNICGYGTSYLVVALLSKYTNQIINKLHDKTFYFVTFVLTTVLYTFLTNTPFTTFYMLYVDYLIGVVLYKHCNNKSLNLKINICLYFIVYISMLIISVLNINYYNILFMQGVFAVFLAVFTILIFKEFKIKNNLINICASGTFSILIIHDNPHIRNIFISKFNLFNNLDNILLQIMLIIIIAIIIFFVCLLIHYKIYKPIEQKIFKIEH